MNFAVRFDKKLARYLIVLAGVLGPVAFAQGLEMIRLVVPVPAGGNMDGTARLLAPLLGKYLNATVVVENKPGANTGLASEWVAQAPADGRTLLMAGVSFSTNAVLYSLKYDPFRDLKPIAQITREHLVLAVRADLPAKDVQDLVRLARTQPGGLNCGASPGAAAIGCTYFGHVLGARLVSIPFAGVAPLVNNLLGGQVDLAFVPAEYAVLHAPTGRIRLIALADACHLAGLLSKLPCLEDTFPGFSLEGYLGLLVQGKTPHKRISQLNEAVNYALSDPGVRDRLHAAQQEPVGGTPEGFGRRIGELFTHYQHIIKVTGMQAP